jgi:hypothetical protein
MTSGLTSWTAHLQALTGMQRQIRHDPVVLKSGMGAGTVGRTARMKQIEGVPA